VTAGPVCPQALGNDSAIYERLVASLAPSIWQMDDVKKGILCQLFGGCGKVRAPGSLRLTPGVYHSKPCAAAGQLATDGLQRHSGPEAGNQCVSQLARKRP